MSKADKIPPTPPSVVAQITQLPNLPIDALRAIWRKLFQTDAPTHHRRFLERRIAYKLQEIAFRKENRNLLQNNQKRIQTLIRNGKPLKRNQDDCPIPGTVLIREYKGVEHRVTVTHDGQFEYQGCVYRSLSRIAREITGAQWSGPLFFGLRKPGRRGKEGGER